jgi:hypothetical protein
MYGKQQWRGLEVEGRYSDIMTFFVRELMDDKEHGLNVKTVNEYPHYYFTIEYMSECFIGTAELETIRWILDTSNCAITIEANIETITRIPPDLINRCHIIYRIKDTALQVLKDTDTFSVDAGWYRVHQVTKCNMMEIKPSNYKFDEEL